MTTKTAHPMTIWNTILAMDIKEQDPATLEKWQAMITPDNLYVMENRHVSVRNQVIKIEKPEDANMLYKLFFHKIEKNRNAKHWKTQVNRLNRSFRMTDLQEMEFKAAQQT